MDITKKDFIDLFLDKFGEEKLKLFNEFLIEVNCPQFYDVVVEMYNNLNHSGICGHDGDSYDTLKCDFICSGLAEVASCFIDWDLSSEGRTYWTAFRDAWLNKINLI